MFADEPDFFITLKLDFDDSDCFEQLKSELEISNSDSIQISDGKTMITVKDDVDTENGDFRSYYFIEIDNFNETVCFAAEQYYGDPSIFGR